MNALSAEELRNRWVANAERLDRQGHFSNYSLKQRGEVRRKGYLGSWPPDQAIRMAKELVGQGYSYRTPRFNDDMRDHGVVGDEVCEKLLKILDEVPPESYKPPYELKEPPGYPFQFQCRALGCEVYFKFQVVGTRMKPRVVFWSCHPPVYQTRREKP